MKTDKLEHMFELQRGFQNKIGTFDKIRSPQDKQQFVNQMILALVEESIEIMRETAYKNPKYVKFGWKETQVWDEEKMKEEIVDLWHFLMNLSFMAGMNAEEFYTIYCRKNGINHDRQDDPTLGYKEG